MKMKVNLNVAEAKKIGDMEGNKMGKGREDKIGNNSKMHVMVVW
jgi:hypothetical protein